MAIYLYLRDLCVDTYVIFIPIYLYLHTVESLDPAAPRPARLGVPLLADDRVRELLAPDPI